MSIIGHRGIQVLSDINSVDDLPEAADVESEAVWYIESGDFAPDYIAPSFWDGQQFTEWISLVDGEVLDGIPDSVVTRPADDNSTSSTTVGHGFRFETAVEWPEIGGRLSDNVSGQTRVRIRRVSDSQIMGSKDISSLSANDTFTLDLDNDLVTGETYDLLIGAEGNSYTVGFVDISDDVPITSPDENLTITSGSNDDGISDNAHNCDEFGNVGFS